jgi:acetyl esterase/lipase
MIRLLLLSLCTAAALLTVFKAPTYHLWMLAIAVTEYSWIFLILVILLLLWGIFPRVTYKRAGTIVGWIGVGLLLYPIIGAYSIGGNLPYSMQSALGPVPRGVRPFTWVRMLWGPGAGTAKYQTLDFQADDTTLSLDFYPARSPQRGPQFPGPRPCVVVIHGGSWIAGNSRDLPELNNVLTAMGYNVASVNYRLAPKYTYPAQIRDVASALAFLRSKAGLLRIDTNSFVLLGRSAGAQIALMAAYSLPTGKNKEGQTAPGNGIQGVISYYGPADMVWGYAAPASKWVLDSRKVQSDYLGGSYAQVPDNYASSSAVQSVTPQSPPTLIIHGKNDVLVAYGHSTRLAGKLEEEHVPYYLLTIPWGTHGCDFNLNGPSGQLCTYAVLTFLSQVLQ